MNAQAALLSSRCYTGDSCTAHMQGASLREGLRACASTRFGCTLPRSCPNPSYVAMARIMAWPAMSRQMTLEQQQQALELYTTNLRLHLRTFGGRRVSVDNFGAAAGASPTGTTLSGGDRHAVKARDPDIRAQHDTLPIGEDPTLFVCCFHTMADATVWALLAQLFQLHSSWPDFLCAIPEAKPLWHTADGSSWHRLVNGPRTTIALNEQRFARVFRPKVRPFSPL